MAETMLDRYCVCCSGGLALSLWRADLSRPSATLPYEGRARATILPDGNVRTPLSF